MSPVTGGDLLRSLGSGVLPPGVESARGGSASGLDFRELLAAARAGSAPSGLPVSIDAGLGVELNAEQHERLSAAVDRLEAAGAQRGVVLIDGHALIIDVASRSATAAVGEEEGVLRADGVVAAAGPAPDLAETAGRSSDPLWTLTNDGLGRVLAG